MKQEIALCRGICGGLSDYHMVDDTYEEIKRGYTCLLWDADMRYENGRWRFYRFNGQTRWVEQTATSESKQEQQKYILNAYRVLLTPARSGMVICVPEGNPNKTTKQNNISSICSYMNLHLA